LKQENKAKEKEAKEVLKAQTQPQNGTAKTAEVENEADIDPNVILQPRMKKPVSVLFK